MNTTFFFKKDNKTTINRKKERKEMSFKQGFNILNGLERSKSNKQSVSHFLFSTLEHLVC